MKIGEKNLAKLVWGGVRVLMLLFVALAKSIDPLKGLGTPVPHLDATSSIYYLHAMDWLFEAMHLLPIVGSLLPCSIHFHAPRYLAKLSRPMLALALCSQQ